MRSLIPLGVAAIVAAAGLVVGLTVDETVGTVVFVIGVVGVLLLRLVLPDGGEAPVDGGDGGE